MLGVEVVYGETEQTWPKSLSGLRESGLSDVQLVVSDDHAGLGRARRDHFPGSFWQRCQRHFLQNAPERAPARLEEELHERLRAAWDDSETHEEARQGLRSLAAEIAETEGEETLSCLHFPSTHRLRIRITSALERVNQEIKCRSRVVRASRTRSAVDGGSVPG